MSNNKIVASIPNTITCLSLVCGSVAIIMSFRCMEQIGSLAGWQWACIFMGFSAVFDFLDGAAARALKAYSKIGAELDSLSDLVAFGVAPAMMMFNLMQYHTVAVGQPGLQWLSYAALLVPVFGALRLARFNVEDVGTTTFRGLPIPSGCIFLIGVAGWIATYGYPGSIVVTLLIVLTSLALVGKFKMFSLKFKSFGLQENFRRYVLLVCAVAFLFIYGLSGLAWTIVFYLLLSVLSSRQI